MIKVENLTKFYTDKPAIQNVNFEIPKGEIVGLLGLNGSGKTTTIRILSGFLIPTEGEVFFDGMNLFENPNEIKKRIGYLPEAPPLYEDMNIESYLEFVSRLKGVENISEEIERVCKKTNLIEVKKKFISHLSLGFRKRVGIAQALLGNPEIIILDEPISGLDPKQIVEIRNLIIELGKEHTILLSSHILSEVYQTCDRFLFLHEGTILHNYTKKNFEQELKNLSELEISLSGKSKEISENFLKGIDGSAKIEFISGTEEKFLFQIKTDDQKKFKDKFLGSILSSGMELESIQRKDLTLEQFFVNRIKNE